MSPSQAVGKVSASIKEFLEMETSSSFLLMLSAILALAFANIAATQSFYFDLVNLPVILGVGSASLNKTLVLLVNDGLMALFFFFVGLEIRKEVLFGELSDPKKAAFSIFAAVGGMALPALFFVVVNWGLPTQSGWGIPMATDIAFALGILMLAGSRVPIALKVFLLAVAIVDDLGAVLTIALFYTKEIAANYLFAAAGGLALFFGLQKLKKKSFVLELALGLLIWFFFLKSGVHATIAGILMAFLVRFGDTKEESEKALDHCIHGLHSWMAYFVMPVFAFFNAGVVVQLGQFAELMTLPLATGIFMGLLVGKPLGVFLFSYIASRLNWAARPEGTTWPQIFAVGIISGIGFTMSLFINGLAFESPADKDVAKIAIMLSSLMAMVIGYVTLRWSTRGSPEAS